LAKYPSLLHKGDDQKATPLHYAALNGDLDIVKFLVAKGALFTVDLNGESPLHLAALNGHLPVVKFLVEIGGDINLQSSNGSTPLHLACANQQITVVGYLLSLPKIKRDLKDNMGNNPATVAKNTKLKILLDYFEDDKRELYMEIQTLEDRIGLLDDQFNEVTLRHENDEKSISRAFNQLSEIEEEFKSVKDDMINNKVDVNSISNNDFINNLKNEIKEKNEKIALLESEKRKLNMKSSRAKEDMMRNLTTAHRSLSNLLNIYETSNIAIMDTKNSLESLRTFMISSNLNSNFDMDEE